MKVSLESNSRLAIQEITVFYGTRMLIVFTRAHHWTLYWARQNQSTASHHISARSIL